MSFHRYSVLAAGLLLSVSASAISAQAADMPAPAADPWSGFYLGAQAGYLQGTGSNTDVCESFGGDHLCIGADDGFDFGDNNVDGATAGGYLGFNYRMDAVVMGLEGDFNWDNAEGNGGNAFLGEFDYNMSLNWDASIRARLGIVVDERALLYVTGGPSWLNAELNSSFCGLIAGVNCGDQSTEFGWQIGAGAEYMITDHLSMKAEYVHGWYGDTDLNIASLGGGDNLYAKQDLQTNVVRAGIAYHFGGL